MVNNIEKFHWVLVIMAVLLLSGCGGGSRGDVSGEGSAVGESGTPTEGGAPSSDTGGSPEGTVDSVIRFDVADAKLVFLDGGTSEGEESGVSNLKKLTDLNEVRDVIVIEAAQNGSSVSAAIGGASPTAPTTQAQVESVPDVAFVRYSPSGQLYVGFEGKWGSLDPACAFVKVFEDGSYECVDEEVEGWGVEFLSALRGEEDMGKQVVDFDKDENPVYLAYVNHYNLALRRMVGDQVEDYINENIDVYDFAVGPLNEIYIAGWSDGGGNFFRMITEDKVVEPIADSLPDYFDFLSDGRLYAHMYLDLGDTSGGNGLWRIEFENDEFHFTNVLEVSSIFKIEGDEVYALDRYDSARVNRYYSLLQDPPDPQSEEFPLEMDEAKIVEIRSGKIFAAGTDEDLDPLFHFIDMQDGSKVYDLINGDRIEVYHVEYSESSNTVYFDGLNFANNEYLLGEVNLSSCDSAALTCAWTESTSFGTTDNTIDEIIINP